MPKYDVIKTFKGSPDGRFAVEYKAGEKGIELSDSLAEVALKEKWVKKSPSAVPPAPTIDETAKQKAADIAAAEQIVADLEAKFAVVTDVEKPAVQAELDKAKADLDALKA